MTFCAWHQHNNIIIKNLFYHQDSNYCCKLWGVLWSSISSFPSCALDNLIEDLSPSCQELALPTTISQVMQLQSLLWVEEYNEVSPRRFAKQNWRRRSKNSVSWVPTHRRNRNPLTLREGSSIIHPHRLVLWAMISFKKKVASSLASFLPIAGTEGQGQHYSSFYESTYAKGTKFGLHF